jgi:hypothetical protein
MYFVSARDLGRRGRRQTRKQKLEVRKAKRGSSHPRADAFAGAKRKNKVGLLRSKMTGGAWRGCDGARVGPVPEATGKAKPRRRQRVRTSYPCRQTPLGRAEYSRPQLALFPVSI